jgi:capsid protein
MALDRTRASAVRSRRKAASAKTLQHSLLPNFIYNSVSQLVKKNPLCFHQKEGQANNVWRNNDFIQRSMTKNKDHLTARREFIYFLKKVLK